MVESFTEKRRYFRVNDTINLLHRVVNENQIAAVSYVSNDVLSSCSLGTALEMLNQEAAALAPRLDRRDPEMFDYLKILDSKINLIVQSLNREQVAFSQHDKRDVSLSAAGVAFNNDRSIPVGTLLELRMLLTSCLVVIIVFGRVVHCKDISQDNPQQPYEIGVDYINIKEDDRELLIKHVIKKQMQQLRDKNAQT